MRFAIAAAASALAAALAGAAPAAAQPHSPEFRRGYYDCLAGRFDEEAQSRAYRAGCRAAEREGEDGGPEGGPPGPYRGPHGPPPMGGPGYGGPPGYGGHPEYGGEQGGPGWGAPGGPGYGGGPPPMRPVGVPNVRGMEPAQAMATMAAQGYRNVGTSVVGGAIFGFYFNPATRECVQLAHANGRVVDAREIGSNPRCR